MKSPEFQARGFGEAALFFTFEGDFQARREQWRAGEIQTIIQRKPGESADSCAEANAFLLLTPAPLLVKTEKIE